MSAKEFRLCVSPLSGTAYISKISKKNSRVMLNDRRALDKREVLEFIVEYVTNNLDDDIDVMPITLDGDTVLEIKINRELMIKHNIL